ncbi:hypothetical protein XELAEV_18044602mg, partial [Xenopus laevis]
PEPGAGSVFWGEGGRVWAPHHGDRVRGSTSGSYTAPWERDRAVPHEADGPAGRLEPAGNGLTSSEGAVSHCLFSSITSVADSFLFRVTVCQQILCSPGQHSCTFCLL